uniref:Uncharacterized protein n=1 Tax=Ananas comosus var. bracteatus TaxID=296719 RepID=A0A6V7PYE8_ANACO|nr:unnamed protein product [Ananas comosus var. bracteatus]
MAFIRGWGPLSFSHCPLTLSHSFPLSLSRKKRRRRRRRGRKERKRRRRGRRRQKKEEDHLLPSLLQARVSLELGLEVSERVGEDGSLIRRASAELSPKGVLKGSLRPEELKRRARTAASSLLPSRHHQEVGGVHPEAIGLPFMS